MMTELIPEVNRACTVIHNTAVEVNKFGANFPLDGTIQAEELPNYIKNNLVIDPDNAWSPNPTWWDIESEFINNPTPISPAGIIYLITDSSPTLSLTMTSAYGWQTSDGKSAGSGALNITWDTTKDKPCYDENGIFLYNTRWVIIYYGPDNSVLNSISATNIPIDALYFVGFNIRTNSMTYGSRCPLLESYKFINSSFDGTSLASCFANSFKLRYAPSFPTPNCINFSSMFSGDINLTLVEEFDQSKSTNNSSQFATCGKLKRLNIPNSPLCTNWTSWANGCSDLLFVTETIELLDNATINLMFNGCSSLITLPIIKCKTANLTSVFAGCASARYGGYIEDMSVATTVNTLYTTFRSMSNFNTEMDWGNVTTAATPFTNATGIVNIKIKNLKVNLVINHNALSVDSIMYIIRNAANSTAITLTIGSVNLAKLSASQKAEATAKLITLA